MKKLFLTFLFFILSVSFVYADSVVYNVKTLEITQYAGGRIYGSGPDGHRPPRKVVDRRPAPPPPPRRDVDVRPAPPPPPRRDVNRRPAPPPPPRRDVDVRPAPPPPPKRDMDRRNNPRYY